MELQFVAPKLSELDELRSEVLACVVWQDVRPCHGLAGLCDWRFAGQIARLQQNEFLRGELGEVLLLPGRPRMSFDKLLLFGAGCRADFSDARFRTVTTHMLQVIQQLKVRAVTVQLPGRADDQMAAERAADMLLETVGQAASQWHQHIWTLVEDAEARKRIEQHMIEERRRVRLGDEG